MLLSGGLGRGGRAPGPCEAHLPDARQAGRVRPPQSLPPPPSHAPSFFAPSFLKPNRGALRKASQKWGMCPRSAILVLGTGDKTRRFQLGRGDKKESRGQLVEVGVTMHLFLWQQGFSLKGSWLLYCPLVSTVTAAASTVPSEPRVPEGNRRAYLTAASGRRYEPPHPRGQWPLCANIVDPVRTSVVCSGPAQIAEVTCTFACLWAVGPLLATCT